jgi:hypothetical protein
MTTVRCLAALLGLAALVPLADISPADAQTAACRPWCRERTGGGTNCGFVTFEQCMWSAYGADICMPNGACPPPSVQHGDGNWGPAERRRR